jgi:hypothetical protein
MPHRTGHIRVSILSTYCRCRGPGRSFDSRSSLRFGLCCPNPASLNRPHPPHLRAHHNAIALRLIWDSFAVRERLGDPQLIPRSTCSILPGMSSSTTLGSLPVAGYDEWRQLDNSHRWDSHPLDRRLVAAHSRGPCCGLGDNPATWSGKYLFHPPSVTALGEERAIGICNPLAQGNPRAPSERPQLLPVHQLARCAVGL